MPDKVKNAYASKLLLLRVYERQIQRRVEARRNKFARVRPDLAGKARFAERSPGDIPSEREAEEGLESVTAKVLTVHPDKPRKTIDMVSLLPSVVQHEEPTTRPTTTTTTDACHDVDARFVSSNSIVRGGTRAIEVLLIMTTDNAYKQNNE